MRGVVAVTDFQWYEFLRTESGLDEVNFWRPSDKRTPRKLVEGMPFLFKLKEAHGGAIVGFGTFAYHSLLPAWLAWETFERRNGAATFEEMRHRIERLRPKQAGAAVADASGRYEIGCLMISVPIFFDREDWIAGPQDWPKNVVQGMAYDLESGEGQRIWTECLTRARGKSIATGPGAGEIVREGERYGVPVLVKPRLGQGTFKVSVMEAYQRACAVSTEHSLPVLEAAHILPYAEGGEHRVANGLLLRTDIHRLYDRGYVTITPDFRFLVSRRLKDEFENGRTYYAYDGNAVRVPEREADRPDRELLAWHVKERFQR